MGGLCQAGGAIRRNFGAKRTALLASSAPGLASALPAAAQDAMSSSTRGSGDYTTATNWNPAAVRTGTAYFATGSRVTAGYATKGGVKYAW
ncbi:hypothetical protein [Afipia sp. GAS231]|uniref:hypothetical protein n=1 Tax=Afipia sp. GAS231 TaxID=1882747 RepID=UPI000B86AA9E|nr:hypothetical protein [Afipia sp. GAS231]